MASNPTNQDPERLKLSPEIRNIIVSTTKIFPRPLVAIANTDNAQERALALLGLQEPDLFNQLYIALVQSINKPEAGNARLEVLSRVGDVWNSSEWFAKQQQICVKLEGQSTVMPLVEYFAPADDYSQIDDLEQLAEALLGCPFWVTPAFAPLVGRASCSFGPAGSLLRARALITRVIKCVKRKPNAKRPYGSRSSNRKTSLAAYQKIFEAACSEPRVVKLKHRPEDSVVF
jgi:hypothetical protein